MHPGVNAATSGRVIYNDWIIRVRCLFEVGISKVMFAQVGLLVHALSILNIDGLYDLQSPPYYRLKSTNVFI